MMQPHEVLTTKMVAMGWSNKEIAGHWHVSENAIKRRMQRIFEKNDFRNRVQAAVWYIRNYGLPDMTNNTSDRTTF